MLLDDVPIGVLVLWRLEVRPFSEDEIQLLATFAEQAALAIRLANVLGETRGRSSANRPSRRSSPRSRGPGSTSSVSCRPSSRAPFD